MKKRIYNVFIKVLAVSAIGIICFYKQSFAEILCLSAVLGVLALMIICSICEAYKEDINERFEEAVDERVEEEISGAQYKVHQQIVFRGF